MLTTYVATGICLQCGQKVVADSSVKEDAKDMLYLAHEGQIIPYHPHGFEGDIEVRVVDRPPLWIPDGIPSSAQLEQMYKDCRAGRTPNTAGEKKKKGGGKPSKAVQQKRAQTSARAERSNVRNQPTTRR